MHFSQRGLSIREILHPLLAEHESEDFFRERHGLRRTLSPLDSFCQVMCTGNVEHPHIEIEACHATICPNHPRCLTCNRSCPAGHIKNAFAWLRRGQRYKIGCPGAKDSRHQILFVVFSQALGNVTSAILAIKLIHSFFLFLPYIQWD